jgi:hypothetical protein
MRVPPNAFSPVPGVLVAFRMWPRFDAGDVRGADLRVERQRAVGRAPDRAGAHERALGRRRLVTLPDVRDRREQRFARGRVEDVYVTALAGLGDRAAFLPFTRVTASRTYDGALYVIAVPPPGPHPESTSATTASPKTPSHPRSDDRMRHTAWYSPLFRNGKLKLLSIHLSGDAAESRPTMSSRLQHDLPERVESPEGKVAGQRSRRRPFRIDASPGLIPAAFTGTRTCPGPGTRRSTSAMCRTCMSLY